MHFSTALVHAGRPKGDGRGPIAVPVYQTGAFQAASAEELADVFAGRRPGFCYTRVGNPTVAAFEERMRVIEGAAAALACASGMAAAFLSIAGACQAGDAIIAPRTLYGGTLELFGDLERMGISVRLVDEVSVESLEGALDDSVRLVFAETISNPRLSVLDVPAVAAWCHGHGLALVVDNTLASPALARPLELGADVVVESASKQISGSGTVIGGVICVGGGFRWDPARFPALAPWRKFGPLALMAGLRKSLYKDTGACMAPMTAFLGCVGLETLSLRMERACANALELARWLDGGGLVGDVGYLGLDSHPCHELAKAQLDGRFGALLTFRAGSRERAFRFLNRVRVALLASNIGDARTLVLHPASTIFLEVGEKDRELAGVFEDTVRVSVGIEDVRDLISDFEQALR